MLKDKTTNIIINAVKPFKVILDFVTCEIKDKQAYFKFKICNKINSAKMISFADDIRMRLACREKVKIEIVNENTIVVILPEEFAEESDSLEIAKKELVQKINKLFDEVRAEIREMKIQSRIGNTEEIEIKNNREDVEEAIKDIKQDLKDGKTADMLTLMKALDIEYDRLDKQRQKVEEDEKYIEALKYIIGKDYTSVSDLQRNLSIGYARAASYIDAFEANGYISACDENKKRKVIITAEQFNAKFKK